MKDFEKKKKVLDSIIYRLESDYYKKTLKEILSDLEHYERITRNQYFFLNDEESSKAKQFYAKNVHGRYFGAIGGGMTYSFTPTGLGDIISVSTIDDNGKTIKEDITDISHW